MDCKQESSSMEDTNRTDIGMASSDTSIWIIYEIYYIKGRLIYSID
jgi:hypothetical protein